jgi:hypothetical protein
LGLLRIEGTFRDCNDPSDAIVTLRFLVRILTGDSDIDDDFVIMVHVSLVLGRSTVSVISSARIGVDEGDGGNAEGNDTDESYVD